MNQYIVRCSWGNESCSGIDTSPYLAESKESLLEFLKKKDGGDMKLNYYILTLQEWLNNQVIVQ